MAAPKRSLNAAVVGLGTMGMPIARNLGFKARGSIYLQLHSRSLERASKVSEDLSVDGATCAMRLHNRYSTVTKWSDVIFTVLKDADVARRVLLEDSEALLRSARPGQIIVDHTTTDVETARECHHVAASRGAHFLDAPLSGSSREAFNGQLTIFVGGDEEIFQKVRPLLNMYGEGIHRLGGGGAGAAGKGISQMLTTVHAAAAAEAMHMAHSFGIESHSRLVKALDASSGGSNMLRQCSGNMEVLLRNPGDAAPASPNNIDRVLYDVSLLGSGCADPLDKFPLLEASVRMMEAAVVTGNGGKDLAALAQFVGSRGAAQSTITPPPPGEPAAPLPPQSAAADEEPEFY